MGSNCVISPPHKQKSRLMCGFPLNQSSSIILGKFFLDWSWRALFPKCMCNSDSPVSAMSFVKFDARFTSELHNYTARCQYDSSQRSEESCEREETRQRPMHVFIQRRKKHETKATHFRCSGRLQNIIPPCIVNTFFWAQKAAHETRSKIIQKHLWI